MRRFSTAVLVLVAAAAFGQEADTIYLNGIVLTMDAGSIGQVAPQIAAGHA